jgi:MAF protein
LITLLLASTSPRRRELLSLLGLPFESLGPEVREDTITASAPGEIASRLAQMKAQAAARERHNSLIFAADTVVVLHGKVLSKPVDGDEAWQMLRSLRGREHQVITAIAVLGPLSSTPTVETIKTHVQMRHYGDDEIADYIARGEPFDKAGAYAIQDTLFHPVSRIEGCYANVMGLPLCHLCVILKRYQITPPVTPQGACEAHTGRPCPLAPQILTPDTA